MCIYLCVGSYRFNSIGRILGWCVFCGVIWVVDLKLKFIFLIVVDVWLGCGSCEVGKFCWVGWKLG